MRGFSADDTTLLPLDEHQGLDMVKLLVGAGCDPFSRNAGGKTPLHIALDRNLPGIADYLLSTGKPLPPDALFAILHSALSADWRAQTICSLVGKGVDVCGLSADGNTLLHATVLSLDSSQALGVTKLLVGAGCDPFSHNADSKTPLHIALDRKFLGIADYLVSTGKPLPPDALFAILHSALPSSWRAQTIRSLVGKGVDVCRLSANGNTLLHATVLSLDLSQALDATKLLVGAGCNPSVCNKQGKTALHIAIEKGLVPVTEYILSSDQSLPDDILFSALNSSCPSQDSMIPLLPRNLVSLGALYFSLEHSLYTISSVCSPVDIPAIRNVGAEDACTDCKNICDMRRLLVHKGANIHVRAADGGTLLHIAIQNAQQLRTPPRSQAVIPHAPTSPSEGPAGRIEAYANEFAGSLRPRNTHQESSLLSEVAGESIHAWAQSGILHSTLLDIIEFLVSVGCDPSQCDADGDPPVYFAVLEGHIRVVEYLLLITSPLPCSLLDAARLAPRGVRDELLELLMNCPTLRQT